jgi:hypothetical protein
MNLRGKRRNCCFSLNIIGQNVGINRLQICASYERKELENEGNDLVVSILPIKRIDQTIENVPAIDNLREGRNLSVCLNFIN